VAREKTTKPMLVMKFGGTSLGDAERIERVAGIVRGGAGENQLVVVVSAMAGVTDTLLGAAAAASDGREQAWQGIGEELERRTRDAARQLLSPGALERFIPRLEEQNRIFTNLCAGFSLVREVTPRAMDTLASLGEVLSAHLLEATLRDRGFAAAAIDAVELIVTDDRFGAATPFVEETDARILARLRPLLARNAVPVITGFRGATREGLCTTLGRGASDFTATIVAAALGADEIWIWTDVDGVLTADPRLIPEARVIPEISYREAIELSFFGAKVLHSKAVQPAWRKNIPVWIKNTFNPASAGTRISSAVTVPPGVRAITAVSQACLIAVNGNDELSFPRLAAEIFAALGRDEIPTLMVTQSSAENVICFAVHEADSARARARLERAFELEIRHDYVAALEVMPHVGIVVAVGEGMKGIPGIAGRMFGAVGRRNINVIAIAQGSSELSISFAVSSPDVAGAVRAVHDEFQL
jgi:aspartate kinase